MGSGTPGPFVRSPGAERRSRETPRRRSTTPDESRSRGSSLLNVGKNGSADDAPAMLSRPSIVMNARIRFLRSALCLAFVAAAGLMPRAGAAWQDTDREAHWREDLKVFSDTFAANQRDFARLYPRPN